MMINGGFKIEYGRDIIRNLFNTFQDSLVITLQEIWDALETSFSEKPDQIFFVETLEIDELEKLSEENRNFSTLFGLGGGRAADVAKFLHWKNGATLFQIPTIVSVDAFFTHEIAVRDNGVVKYIGDAIPELIYVDYDIIQKAPVELNRSGLGDILSCHTGLFDWQLADRSGEKPEWNEQLAIRTREVLNDVTANAAEIQKVSETGIQMMMEALNWIGDQCYVQKHPRFEEGSEHHFVYNLEYVTGKHFVHGQAVCLGCFIMSMLQENEPEKVLKTVRETGVDIKPESLGVSWDEIRDTFLSLNDFVIKEKLPYTILYEKDITENFLKKIKMALAKPY